MTTNFPTDPLNIGPGDKARSVISTVKEHRAFALGETATVVLVVDDDASMRVLLEIYLASLGYQVVLAVDGDEAVRIAGERPDVRIMVMDVVMDGLSGQKLVEQIKLLLPQIRILFCSGHPAKALKTYGIHPDAGNFMQKPFRPADLKRLMEELSAPA